jgi:transposase
VEGSAPAATPAEAKRASKPRARRRGGLELELDGIVVRVGRGTQEAAIAAVIRAVKSVR